MKTKIASNMDWKLLLLATKLLLVIFPLPVSSINPTLDEHPEGRILATDRPGFISIDCGVDEDYFNQQRGIFFRSDRDFISTGENHNILPEYQNLGFRRESYNLRSFPEGKRNCYTLQPEQGKNHNYFVRATFMYGNYDGKNQIPKFDLYLGLDNWVSVNLNNASQWISYTIIYFSLTDTIDVCLLNTGTGVPFITSLELRLLNSSIYRTESGSLIEVRQYDVGSTVTSASYNDDIYDRIWGSYVQSDWTSVNPTSNIDIQGSNDSYRIPSEVLATAVQPKSGRSLNYTDSVSCYLCNYYVYFHFAEIEELQQGQQREFTITLNGVKYGPFSLQYLKPKTITLKTPVPGWVKFSIDSTMRTDLPPILNAFSIFREQEFSNSSTDPTDVEAIKAIKEIYKIRRDWQVDPCLPRGYNWNGLNCSDDNNSPRITSLYLSSSKLFGKIASSINDLKALQSLDLSSNELIGNVPEFFAQMPNLNFLNLSGNKLSGSVPRSLLELYNNGTLHLSLDGNPNLCLEESCHKKKQSFLVPIIASTISVLVFLIFLGLIVFFWRMKTKEESKHRSFTYSEITSITSNFKTIIGKGGFGEVYLGILKDGSTQVAVKLLSQSSEQGYREFQAEVKHLLITNHRNLVSLIGYCSDRGNLALVYEYMNSGNLQKWLSATTEEVLSWNRRLQIAVDAAQGLEYLHNGCKPSIIHRDLKTTNILLNEKLQAKIADFGLSRAFATESGSSIVTDPNGTPGYIDPEARVSGNFNKKSDVYSFGIILLELITGRPAIISVGVPNFTYIQDWVIPIIETGDIESIVDPRLQGDFHTNSAWKFLEIAIACVPSIATQRPDMSQVLSELKECQAMAMAVERSQRMENVSTSNADKLHYVQIDTDMLPSPR